MIMLMMISMIIMMLVSINSKCNIIEAKCSEVENYDSKSKVGNHVLMQPNSPLESHFHASVPISTNTANLEEINMMNDVDQRRGKRLKLRRGITMDSGAANNVMPRRMVRNPSAIRPSPSSRKGVHYVTANDGRIPNEGEIDFSFTTQEGNGENFVVQIAEVNKFLGSISYLVDQGFRVTFDKDAATGRDLSMMVHKLSGRTSRFRRDRNIWILDAMIEADFGRQT